MGLCGGGGGSGALRKQEAERQARIKQGMARINATFDGTTAINPATAYDPNATYYDEWGQEWNPRPADGQYPKITVPGGPRSTRNRGTYATKHPNSTSTTDRYQTPEEYRAAQFGAQKLFTGVTKQGGFDDSFYKQRENDYLGVALPQFEQQRTAADKNLTYSLARSGLHSSTAGTQKRTGLAQFAGQQRRNIADQALGSANELRRTVEGQRAQLVSQLQASGDPDATAQLAMASAKAYRAPTAFQPIGNFFADWTNNYAANQQSKAYDTGNQQPMFNFAGAAGGGSSMRTVK